MRTNKLNHKQFWLLKIILFIYFIPYSSNLYSQNREIEKKKIADNKIKTSTCYSCEYIFGKPDSCKVLAITKYDNKGNQLEVISSPTEEYSVKSFYKYDESGNLLELKQITRNDTTIWTNEYDSFGKTIKQYTFKNSKQTAIYLNVYESDKLISRTGHDNQKKLIYVSSNKYNKSGKVIENLFFNGTDTVTAKFIYNANNKLAKTTSKTITEYFYEQDTIALKRYINEDKSIKEEKFQYDDKKRIIQIIHHDSGAYNNTKTIIYNYDNKGNKIEEITTDSNFPNNYSKILYLYDDAGNLISKLRPNNPEGVKSKTYLYNEKHQLITKIEYEYKNDSSIYQFTYDEYGNKIQEIKKQYSMTFINEYEYNSKRSLTKENNYCISKDNKIKELTQTIEYEYNISEELIRATYKNFLIDLLYQKYSEKYSTGKLPDKNAKYSTLIYSIVYKYDDKNNLIEEYEDTDLHKSSGNNFHPKKYYYDNNNNLIENITFDPNSETLNRKSVFEYDSSGNLTIEKRINGGNKEAYYNIVYFYYDSENHLTDKFTYHYKGKESEHIKYIYDSTGKIIEEKKYKNAYDNLIKYTYEYY